MGESAEGLSVRVDVVDLKVAKKINSLLETDDSHLELARFCNRNYDYAVTYIGQLVVWNRLEDAYKVSSILLNMGDTSLYINENSLCKLSNNVTESYKRYGVTDIGIPYKLVAKTLEILICAENGWDIKRDLPEDGKILLGSTMQKLNKHFLNRMFTPTDKSRI